MTRARSLSRLANTNAFTVDASNNVGIGSTQPDVRLDVNGDMNVTGTLTYEDVTNVETAGITTTGGLVVTGLGATIGGITTFFGDINFGAAGVGGTITTLGHAEFAGVVTATSFSGDGSALTGVASTENINTSTLAQFTGGVGIADSIFHIGDDNTVIRFPAADTFAVETSGDEALRVDSSQRLLIGPTSSRSTHGGGNARLQVEGTNTESAGMSITRTSADAGSPTFSFGKTRNGSALSDGDDVGVIYWQGDDGTDLHTALCSIKGEVDGSVSGNTVPGRITFNTATTSTNLTERLRITSGGEVIVNGTAAGSNAKFEVQSTTGSISSATLRVSGEKTSTGAINTGSTILLAGHDGGNSRDFASLFAGKENGTGSNHDAYLAFGTRSNGSALAERLRVGAAGSVHIGDNTSNANGHGLLSLTQNASAAFNALVIQQGNTGFTATDGLHIGIDASVDSYIKTYENRDIYFTTGTTNTEKLRIKSDGKVGIATASPAGAMEIHVGNGSGIANTLVLTRQFSSNYCAITWKTESGGTEDWSIGQNTAGDFEVFHAGADAQTAFTIKDSASGNYHVLPGGDNAQDLGSSSLRWANVYSADLQLSNEGSSNDVDGTWGQYTIQEGEDDLFLLNRRNGKTYKFVLEEVN